MDDKIIATFCLCDDLLKAMHHPEDRQCQMNDAEIMTTAFIASLFFRGNHESARAMLQQHGYIERVAELMLNKFNGLYGTKIELVKHRYKENTRRTRTECYPGVLCCR